MNWATAREPGERYSAHHRALLRIRHYPVLAQPQGEYLTCGCIHVRHGDSFVPLCKKGI